ncbi:hypothetical protein [Streptomyces sp. RG80]|uniref:hypothetical protein n=1 Tax=Streptomyces sp. RG80 TaxID=3157340 RepID=UPI00338EC54A
MERDPDAVVDGRPDAVLDRRDATAFRKSASLAKSRSQVKDGSSRATPVSSKPKSSTQDELPSWEAYGSLAGVGDSAR